ncbi:MAG: hypothetical protein V7K50_23070 [Nostoc sp.]
MHKSKKEPHPAFDLRQSLHSPPVVRGYFQLIKPSQRQLGTVLLPTGD